jgi:hypothetical protein
MTTQYKSKTEVQASQQSQDYQSQDNRATIPIIDGIEGSLETLYFLERTEAHKLTQGVRVAAYKDEFTDAIAKLHKGQVSPDFFANLQRNYSPAHLNHAATPSLIPSGVKPLDTSNLTQYHRQTVIDRHNHLIDLGQIDSAEFLALEAYLKPEVNEEN